MTWAARRSSLGGRSEWSEAARKVCENLLERGLPAKLATHFS